MAQPGETRGSSLLPWIAASEQMVHPSSSCGGGGGGGAAPALSLVDRMAAPTAFMHQALVFERMLDAVRLQSALAEVLALLPTLACRASKDQDGEWALCQHGGGAPLTLGTSSASQRGLVPHPPPLIAPMPDLGAELFGHLPGLPADGTDAAAVPLAHVALVALGGASGASGSASGSGGGCVLGLRVSHLVGDFGTLRALLHHLARAYNRQPLAAADVPAPVAPLVAALAAQPAPAGARAHNYLPFPPKLGERMADLAAAPPLQGLVLHVPAARLAQLKEQAVADIEAAAADTSKGAAVNSGGSTAAAAAAGAADKQAGEAGQEWVSTHDALMAWLWRTVATLPCRKGAVVAFNQGLDMRRRLPTGAVAACHPGGTTPRWLYGNLATSAYTPPLDAPALSLGRVALELRRTVPRDAAQFAVDMALVAAGEAAGTARPSRLIILPVLSMLEDLAAGKRTLVMASQLALDYDDDACFEGQLPVFAVCTFGRLLIPVVHSQPAPPAAGGGMQLYAWLPADEAAELVEVVGGGASTAATATG